jgi:hypothetical protein
LALFARSSTGIVLASIIVAGTAAGQHAGLAAAPLELASHRAVYDLRLLESRGRRMLSAVQGRIVYDFSGTACEGYALQFRQVTELDSGEGKVAVSDLRSTSWEDGAGKSYRFNFQNYVSRRLVESVDGRAERRSGAIAVSLTKPKDRQFEIDAAMVFPTEHMKRIIEAARAGQSLLELPVYDGSESGEKLYNTLSVIGREIPAGERPPTDAGANQPALAGVRRWPVTISYFERGKGEGDQTPAYAISFELYENGISRALVLDYGDFAVAGEMSTLEIRDTKPCP